MKKNIIILASMLFCMTSSQAQGLYVKAEGSFALGWPWTYSANEASNQIEMSTTGTQVHSKNSNFGNGISPSISAGYMFNSNIGFEIGLGYQFGKNRVNKNTFLNPSTLKTYPVETRLKCDWFWVNPQFVLATQNSGFSPYGRLGVRIGFSPKMTILAENKDDLGVQKTEISGGMPWGFNVALGIKKELTEKISFFGELEMLQMNYSPTNSEIVEFKDAQGNDILSTLSEKNTKTEFTDSWKSPDIVDESPNKAAKINIPMSSFKLNFGIRFNF